MELDGALAVRAAHVAAAAVAVGVPLALFLVLRSGPEPRVVEGLVGRAERWQWVALGVLVATGVGNLGVMGEVIPDTGSAWGRVLVTKLGFVLALLVVAAVRTFVIAGLSMSTVPPNRLAAWYAVSAVVALAVVLLAVVLAHG